MKSILILLYDYYPTPSANTYCTDNIFNAFIEEGYELYIITTKSQLRQKSITSLEKKITIVRRFILIDYINRIAHKLKFKLLKSFLLKIIRVLSSNKIDGYTGYYNSKSNFKKTYKLMKKKKIDKIISFSFPFATHQLAYNLKSRDKSIKWISYEFDPFAYNYTLNSQLLDARKKLEIETFIKSDLIISTLGIIDKNTQEDFRKEYLNKNIEFALPNLSIKEYARNKTYNAKIKMAYLGVFYEGIRTPKRLFDILNSKNIEDIEVHLYGDYNPSVYKDLLIPQNVHIHGKITKQQAHDVIVNSDILINFGNIMTNQFPSKMFEYMSYGKPILNFYYSLTETEKKYSDKYKNILNLSNYSEDSRDLELLIEFCRKNKNYTIEASLLKERLSEYTSNVVVTNIIKQVKKYFEDI